MKRFLLTLILAFTTFVGAMAITVSGTVTSSNTNLPVANHSVFLINFDSLNGTTYIYDTTSTNANGWYSFNFSNPNPNWSFFYVTIYDCNGSQQYYNSNTSTTTANFSICTSQVTNPCQASFFSVPDSMNQSTIHFINTSTGNPTSYQWSFGDGTSSSVQNPTHSYNGTGYYFVTLTISGSGCQSTTYDTVYVGGLVSCQAMFTSSTNPSNPLQVYFSNISSSGLTTFLWNFGDGTTSNQYSPSHTYSTAGTYTVVLSGTGANGCSSSFTGVVTVSNSTTSCQASFFPIQDSANSLKYYFIDQSIGNPTSWLWNFGDNTSSNLQYPNHIYSQAGVYIVTLTIFGANCQSYTWDTLFVGATNPCNASFTYSTNPANPFEVDFYAFGMGNAYNWSFGDGSSSTIQNPSHIYSQQGTYNVTLTVMSSGAVCSSTQVVSIANSGNLTLAGQVTAGGSILDFGDVTLFDVVNGVATFVQTDSSGYFYFGNLAPSQYIINAAPGIYSMYLNNYFPTYYGNATTWTLSSVINLTSNIYNANISLVPVVPSNGGGSISGTVTSNVFKTGIPNVPVSLFNSNGSPVKATKTNNSGQYNFANIGLESYMILVEVPGLPSDTINVTLTQNQTSSTTNNFTITSTNIVASGVGMDENPSITFEKVYPVPFSNELSVEIYLNEKSEIKMEIVNAYGQVVKSFNENLSAGSHGLKYNVADLSSGTYFLRTTNQNGKSNHKVIIKL